LPLDNPDRCHDIYLQQAATVSSHVHSKSLSLVITWFSITWS